MQPIAWWRRGACSQVSGVAASRAASEEPGRYDPAPEFLKPRILGQLEALHSTWLHILPRPDSMHDVPGDPPCACQASVRSRARSRHRAVSSTWYRGLLLQVWRQNLAPAIPLATARDGRPRSVQSPGDGVIGGAPPSGRNCLCEPALGAPASGRRAEHASASSEPNRCVSIFLRQDTGFTAIRTPRASGPGFARRTFGRHASRDFHVFR
jgi:hypothetical protein